MSDQKLPALMFYVGDWLSDNCVRSLSLEARGLWFEMLCQMHKSDRRGYLQLKGKPIDAVTLARMSGGGTAQVSRLLRELKTSGVFSQTDNGIIYNRRMVADQAKRFKCSEAGRRGGGNPKLATFKGTPKGAVKGHSKGALEDENESENAIERLLTLYPIKTSRGRTEEAIRQALCLADETTLTTALHRYIAECAGRHPRFIKYPETWFNGRCWEDEPVPAPPCANPIPENNSPLSPEERAEIFAGIMTPEQEAEAAPWVN